VNQFARVAHTVDFMYCYSILEANKRADFGAGNAGGSAARRALAPDTALNAFFPFDPYNLPRSAAYIAPVYRDWASVAIGDEDEDEDEEDEEDEDAEDEDVEDEDVEDEDVEDEEHVGGDEEGEIEAVGEDPGQLLGQSFEGMSISPMRPAVLT
jgi:RNA polymerase I-specific transcription initiation factor RRN3